MIGSLVGGMIGKAGADSAASGITNATNQAYASNNAQMDRNYAAQSPYMSAGQGATGIIGQLLGLGTLTGNANGIGSSFQADPNGQRAGQNVLQSYINGSGAKQPTLNPYGYVGQVNSVSNKFEADPSYAFRQAEGQKALERGAAARGTLLSGEQFKDLSDFNSGLASQEYGNWFNRLMNQNQYNLDTNRFNLASNQQRFGQEQQQFQNQYGQYRDALGDYFNLAGMGTGAANSLTGANTSLAGNTSNALMSGAQAAGQATMQGANALASGIGSGINNMISGAYMGFNPTSGIFRGGGGGASGYGNLSGFANGAGPMGPSGRY